MGSGKQLTGGKRRISVLGSTGSVGCNTIDIVRRTPDLYELEALTANNNVRLLAEQALQLRPKIAVIGNEQEYANLKTILQGTGIEVAAGRQAIIEAAARPTEWVMSAIVGAAGLEPTLAAIRQGAIIGLANKETLVCAGHFVMKEVARHGAVMLPVDSEHSAIFQVLETKNRAMIEKIILTASGGPFRTWSSEAMAKATPEQAVAHPNWKMGAKISVDSASMMNKGLELIEAHHLFDLEEERIEILVHPQSVIHSMVAYQDGSILAQLGSPDMRTPIAYALGWPARIAAPADRLDFAKASTLTFEAPDERRFPALRLARHALRRGGAATTFLNAANEIAVAAFLDRKIGFGDIPAIVEEVLTCQDGTSADTLPSILALDGEARRLAAAAINRKDRSAA